MLLMVLLVSSMVYLVHGSFGFAPDGSFVEHVDGDCMCMKYEFYCQQPDYTHPYYASAEHACSLKFVQPGGPTGRLAVLRNSYIDNKVRQYIVDNNMDGPHCITKFGFWIGLEDTLNEGEFIWSDGESHCQDDYSNWAPGEPNNNPKKDDSGQDCVQLWFRFGHNGKWDDDYCDFRPRVLSVKYQIPIVTVTEVRIGMDNRFNIAYELQRRADIYKTQWLNTMTCIQKQ
ncbi:C-type lectin domain family 19 member A-like isoform X2 [Ptychodera flava]|uniref:C-type lectin domain family 19 member A-like isoform X2 n=1 Tax=Ptychodera flava TaxID=63121 RepID=UPI00396A9700